MAAAAQETNLQNQQTSTMTNIETKSRDSFLQNILDFVKKKLAMDLEEIGIELIRLNIESLDIVDKDVNRKIIEQSYKL